MNWIDILIVVPLLWGGYNGFKKGLISQVFGTIGLIIGIWLGVNFPEMVEFLLKGKVDEEYLKIISFVVIFLSVVLVTALLCKFLEKIIDFVQLKIVNKLGGILVGGAKILLFMVILCFILENWDKYGNVISQEQKSSSLLYSKLAKTSEFILPELQQKTNIVVSSDSLNTIFKTPN